ncbi:MAG: VOC family protein [Aggregatilineales bacterium]
MKENNLPTQGFKVQQIDHIELNVTDLYQAAAWYKKVFGLEVINERWADVGGPLFVSSDSGSTNLALFEGDIPGDRKLVGDFRVAFRVDGEGFLAFLERAGALQLKTRDGGFLSADDYVDHDESWSVYFTDPYGNRFEITSYDYDIIKHALVR